MRERRRERERKITLDDGDTSGSPGRFAGNRSGRAGLKQEADVAVGVWSSQERPKHKKTPRAEISERTSDTPLGYSGRRALRREQCKVFVPCKNL